MPYIDKYSRFPLLEGDQNPTSPGELNFLLSTLVYEYVKRKGISYQHINDVVGALECAKQEFIRRVVNPYEDKKIIENGDVYD